MENQVATVLPYARGHYPHAPIRHHSPPYWEERGAMGGGYPLQDGGGQLVSVLRLPRVGRGNCFGCVHEGADTYY